MTSQQNCGIPEQIDQSRRTPLASSPDPQVVTRAIERRAANYANYDHMSIFPQRMHFNRYRNETSRVDEHKRVTSISTQMDLSIGVRGVLVVHWEVTQTYDK